MTYPRRRTPARSCLGLFLAASLGTSTVFLSGCGFFHDKTELKESRRVSNCRSDARRACRKLAKEDESVDVDECVSDRAWRCALGEPEPSEPTDPSDSADGEASPEGT